MITPVLALICIVLIVSIIVLYIINQDKTCTHKGVKDPNAEYTTDEEGKCKFVRCKDTTYIQDSTGICVLDQSGQGCTPEGTPDANAIYETNVSNVCEFNSCIIGYEVGENDICIMAELEDESNGDDPEPDANDGDEDGGGGADGGSDGGTGGSSGGTGGPGSNGGTGGGSDASCAPLIDNLSGYDGSTNDTTGTAEYKDATDNWWVFHGDDTVVTVPDIMHTYSSNSTDSGYNLPVSKPWTCGNIDVVYLWYRGGTNGEMIQGYFVSDF